MELIGNGHGAMLDPAEAVREALLTVRQGADDQAAPAAQDMQVLLALLAQQAVAAEVDGQALPETADLVASGAQDEQAAPQVQSLSAPGLEQLEDWLQQQQQLQGLQLGAREWPSGARDADDLEPQVAQEVRARHPADAGAVMRQLDLRAQAPQPQLLATQEPNLDERVRTAEPRAEAPGLVLKMPALAEALGLAPAHESSAGRSGEPALLSPAIQSQAGPVAPQGLAVEARPVAAEARWGEQMLLALREQVELQVQQRSQQATIRLDPPDLGSLDIHIQHEQGKLSVQINAAQADVARLLNLLSERLRHELMGQNFTQVEVQVGADAEQGRQGRQRPPAEELVRQARELPAESTSHGRTRPDDVLISV